MALTAPINAPVVQEEEIEYSKNTAWKRFRKHKLAMAGVAVLLFMVVVAIFAWKIAPFDPNAIDNVHWQGDALPPCFQDAHLCGGHALGTDEDGRDLLSRLMYGAQISLTVGVAAVVMELVIGTLLGALAGYYGTVPRFYRSKSGSGALTAAAAIAGLGATISLVFYVPWGSHIPIAVRALEVAGVVAVVIAAASGAFLLFQHAPWKPFSSYRQVEIGLHVDYVIMRFTDVFLSIPLLPLLLTLTGIVAAVSTKASLDFKTIVLVIGALSWPGVARLVRASYLSLREREYAEAARALGNGDLRIMLRHLLPNAIAPIIVQATLDVANVIVLESTLSFLGFGIQPPTASWGNMLANAESNLAVAWWAAVFPGLCILVTVLAINYIGDGLRDALDPNMR
jgi:peptide/nickel transport system permease protein